VAVGDHQGKAEPLSVLGFEVLHSSLRATSECVVAKQSRLKHHFWIALSRRALPAEHDAPRNDVSAPDSDFDQCLALKDNRACIIGFGLRSVTNDRNNVRLWRGLNKVRVPIAILAVCSLGLTAGCSPGNSSTNQAETEIAAVALAPVLAPGIYAARGVGNLFEQGPTPVVEESTNKAIKSLKVFDGDFEALKAEWLYEHSFVIWHNVAVGKWSGQVWADDGTHEPGPGSKSRSDSPLYPAPMAKTPLPGKIDGWPRSTIPIPGTDFVAVTFVQTLGILKFKAAVIDLKSGAEIFSTPVSQNWGYEFSVAADGAKLALVEKPLDGPQRLTLYEVANGQLNPVGIITVGKGARRFGIAFSPSGQGAVVWSEKKIGIVTFGQPSS
jgi:hypothetical protein